MMALYIFFWMAGVIYFGFEFWALSMHPEKSVLLHLQRVELIPKSFEVSTSAGHSLSMWLGWTGLGLMIIMNLYTMRKKFSFMRPLGSLKGWLDFHVFCGLLGPTLVIFHCNFHVRGLVAISFWSMIVSLTSGIIGRYFYVQLLTRRADLEDYCERISKRIDASFKKRNLEIPPEEKQKYMGIALQMAGVPSDMMDYNPFAAMFRAVIGDIRLSFADVPIGPTWPRKLSPVLRVYAETKRKQVFIEPFQKLMGYWHSFHFPFAVFMYIAAVIHVASSLLLKVN